MKNIQQVRNDVYQKLKFWDKRRAQILKHHKKSIEQIQQFLEKRISDCQQYISNLHALFQYRINELESQLSNSLMNSDYILEKNKVQAYQTHYDVLKNLIGVQATQIQENQKKLKALYEIFEDIKKIVKKEENTSGDSKSQTSEFLDKGQLKYLMEYQLQQIVENVLVLGQKVSNSFSNNKNQKQDLYLSMLFFVHQTHKQAAKHREIGRQLISLCSKTMKTQIKIQNKIRGYLKAWNQFDGPVDQNILAEINNKDIHSMIKSYYDLNSVANIQFEEPSIQDFLINFQIDSFVGHEKLRLCEIEATYNNTIQTIVLITLDNYVHLLRMNNPKPDFSFILNSQLQIKSKKQRCVHITQFKKWMYFKKQAEFEFELQFHSNQDFMNFKNLLQKFSPCKIK